MLDCFEYLVFEFYYISPPTLFLHCLFVGARRSQLYDFTGGNKQTNTKDEHCDGILADPGCVQ